MLLTLLKASRASIRRSQPTSWNRLATLAAATLLSGCTAEEPRIVVFEEPLSIRQVRSLLPARGIEVQGVAVEAPGLSGSINVAGSEDWSTTFRGRMAELAEASRQGRAGRIRRMNLDRRSPPLTEPEAQLLRSLLSVELNLTDLEQTGESGRPVVRGVVVVGPRAALQELTEDPRVGRLLWSSQDGEPGVSGEGAIREDVAGLSDEELVERALKISGRYRD